MMPLMDYHGPDIGILNKLPMCNASHQCCDLAAHRQCNFVDKLANSYKKHLFKFKGMKYLNTVIIAILRLTFIYKNVVSYRGPDLWPKTREHL